MVNIAGLAALITTFLEKYVGFWAAFIPPAVMMVFGMIPLITYRTKFGKLLQYQRNTIKKADEKTSVRSTPSGAVLVQAAKAMWLAARSGFHMNAAKPEAQAQNAKRHRKVPWDDRFIEELKLGLFACRILYVSRLSRLMSQYH